MPRRTILPALGTVLLLLTAHAGAEGFAPPLETRDVAVAKRAAEEAYRQKQYEAAFAIYRDDLAPMGDAYAQYMVGIMLLQGQGTEANVTLGAAWLHLAATRSGNADLVRTRDDVFSQLPPATRGEVMALSGDLEIDFGDCGATRHLLALEEDAMAAGTSERRAGDEPLPLEVRYVAAIEDGRADTRKVRTTMSQRRKFLKDECR